jgi:ribosomal protein S27AE
MQGIDIKFCLQCGTEGVMAEEVTPSHVVKLYCANCGMMAKVLLEDEDGMLVGANLAHDPDSDFEAW